MTLTQHALPFPDFAIKPITWRTTRKKRDTRLVARCVSLGAGLQSSVLAEMAILGELEADLIIFADTGCEPPWVYEQVWYLAEKAANVDLPFIIAMQRKGMVADMYDGSRTRFVKIPFYTYDRNGKQGMMQKQCSKEYKKEPFSLALRRWLLGRDQATKNKAGHIRTKRGLHVDVMIGFTWDEVGRINNSIFPMWQNPVYPLIDARMKRDECETWLRDRGFRVPYKSACIFCPFSDNERLKFMKKKHPGTFEIACAVDDWLRNGAKKSYMATLRDEAYVHRSGKPLREVDFDDPELPLFSEAVCGGLCDV